MNNETMIKMALAHKGISQAELARMLGDTPANFNQKIKNDTFKKTDLAIIAETLGFTYETLFKSPNGTVIGGVVTLPKKTKGKK
ncbi:MAG: helix-turn-helix transcriptional regulator [Treponema sp.]|jgi:transcriptional regulator with XRE-family HTH domain|nr:helix-turn-helix transcriptional regulator [Treponema sp.]